MLGASEKARSCSGGNYMPRKPDPKNAYLEKHDGYYRVTVGVPAPLHPQLGRRLKHALGVKSKVEANELKAPVVQEFKARIEKAWENIGGRHRSALIEATAWAREMSGPGRPGELSYEIYSQLLREREADILSIGERYETFIDDDGNVFEIEIPTPAALEAAKQFGDIARGTATPLGAHHDAFLQTLSINERSLSDDVRALNLFTRWCIAHDVPPYLERIDAKIASKFRDTVEEFATLQWASANKYLGRLRLYWSYLVEAGHLPVSPWLCLRLDRPAGDAETEERAFRDTEVQMLLMGAPPPGMMDAMLVGALTGARVDAIINLRVGECVGGLFTFKPHRKGARAIAVPIHPQLKSLVAARSKGKNLEDDLFPEWPGTKSDGSIRERSAYFSKRFTAYRRSVGVDEQVGNKRRSLVNFQSFRRWFIAKMERAGVDSDLIGKLVGRPRSGLILGRDGSGPEMEAAKRAIGRLKLPPLDGSPVLDAQPLASRRRERALAGS
ncbi:UNVERIFIED_ORG: integrase [Methylobacterium sp. SuP10 SLI 274]|uniref:integrase n=1 Tax=Methylorubrum extorquens TaxID=408 RepID=UPI0020A073C3|nr:integrase [Methylorubrum extorquens]MCP1558831.1 integrase [Methylorubrum extorquens]MDF9792465.1 integrase [Methylorubrum extorquens]MDF9864153.1 integrase [Methylorubrum pseudosasae]MDH6637746.1 integrase [Methylobacterium sp. SuP10 SLI 274]